MPHCTGPDAATGRCAVHGYSCAAPVGVPATTGQADTLGVEILIGDVVTLIGYGWAARLVDTGRCVTVTEVTRSGNIAHDSDEVANGRALKPCVLAVARRDGQPGHEGNRDR